MRKRSDFDSVGDFHQKFGLENATHMALKPHLVDRALMDYRIKFLQEELDELSTAAAEHDLPGIADALVDLVYVALGTAHFHGLPWEALFAEVQRANMTKERAASAEVSKRNSSFDVVKPAGWTPPNINGVLVDHGWPGPKLPL